MEELLAPVLATLNQIHQLQARLRTFIELFGGEEVNCTGKMDHFRWYGTTGFAFLFGGLRDAVLSKPPELLGAVPRADGSVYAVFRASALPVGTIFRDADREYIVVCNEIRGQRLYHRTLFCALLREVVEKMKKG